MNKFSNQLKAPSDSLNQDFSFEMNLRPFGNQNKFPIEIFNQINKNKEAINSNIKHENSTSTNTFNNNSLNRLFLSNMTTNLSHNTNKFQKTTSS